MKNRDAGIALCGVVVGVLLGAGSFLYAQGSSLGADAQDTTAAPSADCVLVKNVVKEFHGKVMYWIPKNAQNTERREGITKAGNAIVSRNCATATTQESATVTNDVTKPAASEKIWNDCSNSPVGTIRYNKCKGSTNLNRSYDPTNMNRYSN